MNIPYAAATSSATGHFFNRKSKMVECFQWIFEMGGAIGPVNEGANNMLFIRASE